MTARTGETDMREKAEAPQKTKRGNWWHENARQMKRDGHSVADIATNFGKAVNSVMVVTR